MNASHEKEASKAGNATGQKALKEKTIYGNRLLIWRNIQTAQPIATNLWAILGSEEYDGKETALHDWKADCSAGTIYVRGQIYLGWGNYHQFENTFPCHTEEVSLKPPGRNFKWHTWSGGWRNEKTGERRPAT